MAGTTTETADGADTWRSPLTVDQELVTRISFTPDMVSAYATLANDTNPLHHDEALAQATRFGGLIASGTQTTGLLLGSVANFLFPGSASLGLECAFKLKKAVPARSEMTIRWVVQTITPKPSLSGVIATLAGGLYDEAGVAAVEATATVLVMRPDSLRRAPKD